LHPAGPPSILSSSAAHGSFKTGHRTNQPPFLAVAVLSPRTLLTGDGIMDRVESWYDSLGIKYEVEPKVIGCMMHTEVNATVDYTFFFHSEELGLSNDT